MPVTTNSLLFSSCPQAQELSSEPKPDRYLPEEVQTRPSPGCTRAAGLNPHAGPPRALSPWPPFPGSQRRLPIGPLRAGGACGPVGGPTGPWVLPEPGLSPGKAAQRFPLLEPRLSSLLARCPLVPCSSTNEDGWPPPPMLAIPSASVFFDHSEEKFPGAPSAK